MGLHYADLGTYILLGCYNIEIYILGAGKLFLSGMGELVSVQVKWLRENLVTSKQANSFSLVCESLCLIRLCNLEKTLSHWKQANSPVWESLWVLRVSDLEKVLLHWVQTNSFPPVWESLCLFRTPDWQKVLSHWVQTNFFSPVWESLCVFRLPDIEIVLPHWSQVNCFAPVWTSLCFFRQLDLEKTLSHWKQENSLSPIVGMWWSLMLFELNRILYLKCPSIAHLPCMTSGSCQWRFPCHSGDSCFPYWLEDRVILPERVVIAR